MNNIILNSVNDWFNSIIESFNNMTPLQMFIVGLGVGVVLLIVIFIIVSGHYRHKRMKTHKISIDFDGGLYQGTSDELVIVAKQGEDIDFTKVLPTKDGYVFNGFNIYKKYVSSSINEKGIIKESLTIEKYDGEKKDIIEMPDYDLYVKAIYSIIQDPEVINLKTQRYYSDFLTLEDLISELKHLNENKDQYPVEINLRNSPKYPEITFLFKNLTLLGFLKNVDGITKVYFRSSSSVDDKLLNPFYEAEDINDCFYWYSFIVLYNTKLSRFIRSFKEAYDEVDSSIPTSAIEFNLICGSLSDLADPLIDRSLFLVDKFEKDRLLDPQPDYVIKRELPPNYDFSILKKEKEKSSFEEKTQEIIKEEQELRNKEEIEEADDKKEEVVEEKVEESSETKTDEVFTETSEVKQEELVAAPEYIIPEGTVLTKQEEVEIQIKLTALNYNREKLCDVVMEDNPQNATLVKRFDNQISPYSFKTEDKTYALVYENRFGLVRIIIKLDCDYAKELMTKHELFKESKFPGGGNFYQFYLDNSFTEKEEVKSIFDSSRIFTKKIIDESKIAEDKSVPVEEKQIESSDESVNPNIILKYDIKDGEVLTELEKEEVKINRTALNYNRNKIVEIASEGNDSVKKLSTSEKGPHTLKYMGKTYAMLYENRFGLVRVIVRLNNAEISKIKRKHKYITPSKFPFGFFWYQLYIDSSFYKKSQIAELFANSREFTRLLVEQEQEKKRIEEEAKAKKKIETQSK